MTDSEPRSDPETARSDVDEATERADSSTLRRAIRHLLHNRLELVGTAIILFFTLMAILSFVPVAIELMDEHIEAIHVDDPYAFVPWDDPYATDFSRARAGLSWEYPLGADHLGRDMLSRVMHGSMISLPLGLVIVAIGFFVGVPLGIISAYYGGGVDQVIQRITDMVMAFPALLLALAVIAILGPGILNAMVAIGIAYIPQYIRLARSSALSAREDEYVAAALAIGANDTRILGRHIFPNCLSPLIVQATLHMGVAILFAAGLGFLGLGAQPPDPEWGAMLSQGRQYMRAVPHLTVVPGVAIFLLVLGFNVLGDGLRDTLDPRRRT